MLILPQPFHRTEARSGLASGGDGIALRRPIAAKVVRNIQHLDVRETHFLYHLERRTNVGALLPRTASAVNDNRTRVRNVLEAGLKPGNAIRTPRRAAIFRTRNMTLGIKTFKANMQQKRFFAGTLKLFGQTCGLNQLVPDLRCGSRKSARAGHQTNGSSRAKDEILIAKTTAVQQQCFGHE